MILLPATAALICMCIGRMGLSAPEVVRTLAGALFRGETGTQNYSIIVNLRLPRILMAVIIGAGLTCAGDTFQALFSNPCDAGHPGRIQRNLRRCDSGDPDLQKHSGNTAYCPDFRPGFRVDYAQTCAE